MKINRKNQILKYIAEITSIAIANKDYDNILTDAFTISLDLNLDRANVSRLLNELWRSNELIKIQGRPTAYLHRKTILKLYPNIYIPALIPKDEDFHKYLNKSILSDKDLEKSVFQSCIGYSKNESLYLIIEDIKIFLMYPQKVHSILINGPNSSGKHALTNNIFRLLNVEEEDICIIDCIQILLGKLSIKECSNKIDILLDHKKKSVVLLDNLDVLLNHKDSTLMIKTLFRDTLVKSESNDLNLTILAIGSNINVDDIEENLKGIFQKNINLPKLDDRTLKEKYEFTLLFMQQEANYLGKTISLSSSILNCFATGLYRENLKSLIYEIRHGLSYAYSRSKESVISISYDDLSDELLTSIKDISEKISIIESITSTLQEKNYFLIPGTECIPLQKLLKYQIHEDGTIKDVIQEKMKLSEYCFMEYKSANQKEVNKIISLSLHKIKKCIIPILVKYEYNLNENQLEKLCLRLNNLLSSLQQNSYYSNFIIDIKMEDESTIKVCEEINKLIKKEFNLVLPEPEIIFIYKYLLLVKTQKVKGNIAVLVVCQGEGIAEKYATHVNTMKYLVKCHYIDIGTVNDINQILNLVTKKIQEIDEGNGVVIITDLNLLLDIKSTFKDRIPVETITLGPTSLPLLIQIMDLVNKPNAKLNDLRSLNNEYKQINVENNSLEYGTEIQKTLNDVSDKILAESLIFLNPQKTTYALFRVLMQIYEDLGINYSNEITIRFVFHSAFMIERVIRKEPLIYKQTQSVIKTNSKIYTTIDKNMQLVNDLFGIQIPSSEIARLSEIFIELIENESYNN